MVSKITTPITPLEQTEKINEIIDNLGIGGFNILEHKWSDHIINDISWLRADTFSWQSGAVYVSAYNHLVSDISGKTATSETVGSYTISYYLADDGHKITTDEATVANIYNESGVAWYYILDTTNQRFKLPRTKYGFTGLRDTVGKYVPESLPNIGCKITDGVIGGGQSSNGAFYISGTWSGPGGSNVWKGFGGGFDASRSSSTYKDNAPVQQRATQMYLYFYVGQFSQSATEQTAGLNSELFNGKVDLNAANLSTAGKSLISGLVMPSDTYESVTVGANGAEYVAPANGWFCIRCKVDNKTSAFQSGYNTSYGGSGQLTSYGYAAWGGAVIPMLKGQTMTFYYEQNTQDRSIRFVYAQGSESEAI